MKRVRWVAALGALAALNAGSGLAADEPHGSVEPRPAARASAPARSSPPAPRPDGRGQVLDQRYNHGRYYPPVGTVRGALPDSYRPYFRGNERYYFSAGIWYAPRGAGFVVVTPPPGLVIAALPPYYSTVWIGGSPYYYADNVYYAWQPDQNGYAVVTPADADASGAPASAPDAGTGMGIDTASAGADDLIIYPKNGQSADQQAADRYECHGWARGQTGFDPSQPDGGVQGADVDRGRSNYYRAMAACLQGRGYQVN